MRLAPAVLEHETLSHQCNVPGLTAAAKDLLQAATPRQNADRDKSYQNGDHSHDYSGDLACTRTKKHRVSTHQQVALAWLRAEPTPGVSAEPLHHNL
jgi:hypothetical protein